MTEPTISRSGNTILVLRFEEGHTQATLECIQADMLKLLRSMRMDAVFAQAAH